MRVSMLIAALVVALASTLTACNAPAGVDDPPRAATPTASASSTTPDPSSTPATPSAARRSPGQSVVGTVVRFTTDTETLDVTIGEDSPATRDFLSLLPLTTTVEEFNGREKIADLPRELDYEGSSGSDPEDGDLIYFIPWGSIGFYYDTSGIGYSDQTLHLGTYDATPEQLARFEGQPTTVEIID